MRVGIPKGLLYYKYYPFLETFFKELGAEIIKSPNTNKEILDLGIKSCIDEACLPVKVFHGHVEYLKDKCDLLVIPRIMQLRKREFICPKFCGLPEMILSSINGLPEITMAPIYAYDKQKLYEWCDLTGSKISKSIKNIRRAYEKAVLAQENFKCGFNDKGYEINAAIVGHPYNLYDTFVNMNIVKKLNSMGVGVITEESLSEELIDIEVKKLFKKPFWTFARNSYGFGTHMALNQKADGIIYISSFACGIDSVVTELIKDKIEDFPFMVLKIDEQTGEAGFDTRIEAFIDMLARRKEKLA